MEFKQIVNLMKAAAQATPSTNYSYNGETLNYDAINETLRHELEPLCGTYELYRKNKEDVFSLVEETINDILPQRIENAYGRFAETRTFKQSETAVFTRKVGRIRAKQFITRVGLAGVYETFKLGETKYEIKTSAIGGAASIGFEEFLDGRVDFAEVVQIVMDGMDELIYREIAKALIGAVGTLPAANFITHGTGFDFTGFDRLISIAESYGSPAIYCTREFASLLVPPSGWVSDNLRDEMWRNGYLANYKGTPVIILPQSFTDEMNTTKTIDPSYAWIIPSGGNDKPVKIAFEGTPHMRERENEDWSRDMQVYQKVGVGVVMTNNICVYQDTDLHI